MMESLSLSLSPRYQLSEEQHLTQGSSTGGGGRVAVRTVSWLVRDDVLFLSESWNACQCLLSTDFLPPMKSGKNLVLPLLICRKHACVYELQCNNSYIGILQNVVVVLILVIFDWFLSHIPTLNWEQGLGSPS